MEFLICMLLAAILTGGRTASNVIHAWKGTTPPHLEKARLKAQQQKASRERSPYAEGKPRLRDVGAAFLGDALQDAIDLHNKRRAAKRNPQPEPDAGQPQGTGFWKQVWGAISRPVGDNPQNAAPESTPAPRTDTGPGVDEQVQQDLTPDGPIIPCGECGAKLVDTDGGWGHPAGSTCPENASPGATATTGWQPGRTAVHHSNEYQIARNYCWECGTCGSVGLDFPSEAAASAAANAHICGPKRADQDAQQRLHEAAATGPARQSAREFFDEHIAAANDAFNRGDWALADQHLGYLEEKYPNLYRRDDVTADVDWPEANSAHDKGLRGTSLTGWRHDIRRRMKEDARTEPTAHQAGDDPATEKENTMTDVSTSGTATGDAHDVESALHECELLDDDLSRIDTALDTIDEAITSAAQAAERIEAFLESKNVDNSAVGGMATARDLLSPDRIKELMDAVEGAKQGVKEAIAELSRLQDLEQQLGGADGSVLNGR